MYEELPAEIRDRHPYFMYDEIRAQPDAIQQSLNIVAGQGAEIARLLVRARRIYVTGCGTSFHAAQVGAWMLSGFSRGKLDARAVEAFDTARYLPGLRPDDLLLAISHSGTTYMTGQALERAHRAGVDSILVTGFPESPLAGQARHVLPTGYPTELGWAHTASYTAAITTLAGLANGVADPEERLDLSPLPAVVREALALEREMHGLAGGVIAAAQEGPAPRIVLVGGGPNLPTAREGVLKILEASYLPAQPFGLEEILHGPLAAMAPGMLVVILAPDGQSSARASQLAAALIELGIEPAVFCGSDNAGAFSHAHRFVLPDLPEILSPIPYVVPLQFLSYFLALGRGVNPDLIHRDQAEQRRARSHYE